MVQALQTSYSQKTAPLAIPTFLGDKHTHVFLEIKINLPTIQNQENMCIT